MTRISKFLAILWLNRGLHTDFNLVINGSNYTSGSSLLEHVVNIPLIIFNDRVDDILSSLQLVGGKISWSQAVFTASIIIVWTFWKFFCTQNILLELISKFWLARYSTNHMGATLGKATCSSSQWGRTENVNHFWNCLVVGATSRQFIYLFQFLKGQKQPKQLSRCYVNIGRELGRMIGDANSGVSLDSRSFLMCHKLGQPRPPNYSRKKPESNWLCVWIKSSRLKFKMCKTNGQRHSDSIYT